MIQRKFFHEMKPFHNHIGTVLDGDRLVRLIGVAESDIDVYYHVRYAGGEEAYMTAVGAFESLKGKLTRYKFLQIYNDYYDNNDWINSEHRVKRDISGILYDD